MLSVLNLLNVTCILMISYELVLIFIISACILGAKKWTEPMLL